MSATPANWSQHARLLTLHTPLGADVLLATEVQIDEALGPLLEHAGLRIHLRAISADARLRPQALLGQPVRLDLATASGPRPFHGHITAFERSGADGGFGHYRLRIEPWLALLGQRSDAYVFQDMSVFDIVDELFADWQGRGTLAPAWRWDVAERSAYPQRSLTIQYHETDLDFLRRLLAEEGLFYWFEHRADGALLVIADHNGAFADNAQPHIRYTQSGATLAADALDRWAGARRLGSSATAMASWDYRSVHMRQQMQPSAIDNGPAAPRLDDTLDPGPYAWHTQADGERLSSRRREALDVRLKTFRGHGTVRSAAPATVFTLDDHPEHDTDPAAQRRFLITAVRHRARNNLPHSGADAYYRCRLDAVRAHIPWRPLLIDADGQPVDLRPHIVGEHSAIVVGEDGAPTHTDRDHRIRIQFHWQRGSRAASRLPHPSGADNAPASDALGTWVRVLSAAAGANWGAHFIPRPGQEVLVTFLHGNPDRPVVVGAAYNGRGARRAPRHRAGRGATAGG
ncbi:type VI secretion system Vgr family protein, partial [Pseudothauera lacus]